MRLWLALWLLAAMFILRAIDRDVASGWPPAARVFWPVVLGAILSAPFAYAAHLLAR